MSSSDEDEKIEIIEEDEEKKEVLTANKEKSHVPLRENMIENAVKFLTHPSVQNSSVGKRIAFLEHKGLNKAEIKASLKKAGINKETYTSASSTNLSRDYQPTTPQLPPRPAESSWKGYALTGTLCVGLGVGAAALVMKYWEASKLKQSIGDLKKEITGVHEGQEEINKEVKETLESVRTYLETSNKPKKRTGIIARTIDEDESVSELKSELRQLKALFLDNLSAQANMPVVGGTRTTDIPAESTLPEWQRTGLNRSQRFEEEKKARIAEEEKEKEEKKEESSVTTITEVSVDKITEIPKEEEKEEKKEEKVKEEEEEEEEEGNDIVEVKEIEKAAPIKPWLRKSGGKSNWGSQKTSVDKTTSISTIDGNDSDNKEDDKLKTTKEEQAKVNDESLDIEDKTIKSNEEEEEEEGDDDSNSDKTITNIRKEESEDV